MYVTEKGKERSMHGRGVSLDAQAQAKVRKLQHELDETDRWQKGETHHDSKIMTPGVNAPAFIRTDTNVRSMQGALGVEEDGIWGPETEKAYRARLAQDRAASEAAIATVYREAEQAEAASSAFSAYAASESGAVRSRQSEVKQWERAASDNSAAVKQQLMQETRRVMEAEQAASPASGDTAAAELADKVLLHLNAIRQDEQEGKTAKRISNSELASAYADLIEAEAGSPAGQWRQEVPSDMKDKQAKEWKRAVSDDSAAVKQQLMQETRRIMEAEQAQQARPWRQTQVAAKKAQILGAVSGELEGTADSGDSLEDQIRYYTERVKKAKAAYESYDMGNWNPRSLEGRRRNRERAQLYSDLAEVETHLQRLHAQQNKNRIDAAYAKSPEALRNLAVQDASGYVQAKGYAQQHYPNNKVINHDSTLFDTEETLFTYAGSVLNYLTDYSGLEHMCGIYSVDWGNGQVSYISGPVVSGMQSGDIANVILPFAACYTTSQAYTTSVERVYAGADVTFEGILHSHPSYGSGKKYRNNERYSWGDGLAALLAGNIFLTTQDGSMYALDREDTGLIIFSGLASDMLYLLNKTPLAGFAANFRQANKAIIQDVREAGYYEKIGAQAYDASKNRR